MNRNSWFRYGLTAMLSVFLCAMAVSAAEYSPALQYELDNVGDTDLVSAIIILESPVDIQALDGKLHNERAPLAKRHQDVINALKYNAEMTQPAFKAELEAAMSQGRLTGFTAYWIENLFVVQATKEFLVSLRDRGDIKYITENFRAELIEPIYSPVKEGADERPLRPNPLDTETTTPGQDAIGATQVNRELGITGQGVLVANLDTGVDGNHPALASRWRGLTEPASECWRDALGGGTTFPSDGNGHGTHVMGTITGRAIAGSDTNTVGSAPNAKWIANNAINQGVGPAFDNDIIDAYQWFADPDGNVNTLDDVPDVIQNSWGVFTGLGYAQCFDMWNTVILNCEAAGPVVTWSAGNESTSGLRSPAIYSINATQIFSVGAVDATNFGAPYPLAGFSSQGPTPCAPANPNTIKPEIAAPGVNVYSSVPGGGYSSGYSGTSMAGPHVAGVVALMREACPDCDPTTIKTAIMETATDTGYGPPGEDNQFGAGLINAYDAVLAVSDLGRIGGVVTDLSLAPVSGAKVKITTGPNQTLTDASGQYYLALSGGTYNVEYSKFGYVTQTINNILVVEGDTTTQNVLLQFAPAGVVSGTVTDCNGNPAVGATVEILNAPVAPAITNGSGFYSINLPQGTYDMRASGAGCGEHNVTGVVVGANTTQNFTLPSDPRFDCSAPDAAGYVACENGDAAGPMYQWFEISPNNGGPGTLTNITGDDQSLSFALPFSYRHYGVNYTTVYISSNGLLTFNSANSSYTNQPLPAGPGGPAIAPFWDDLYPPAGGDISTYYHAAENAFIIEWRDLGHFGNTGVRETFQVWLYNVTTNPSPTGDSQLRLQYQTMNSVASNTVGTTSGAIGNQYVFDGALDPNAQGLENSRVITYGGSTTAAMGTIEGTITDCGGGAAAFADVSFPGSFYPAIQANGSGFYSLNVIPGTYNVRAANATCTAVQSNGHNVVEDGTTTVNITLIAPGILQGTVTSCLGGPAVGATVTVTGSEYSPSPEVTNGAGFYQFDELPAGNYDIDVDFVGCAPEQALAVAVTSGNTTTRNFTLVSDPMFSCSPEDAYGYTACEDVDGGGPDFDWRAITPAEGGPGTQILGLTDDSFNGPNTLPFPVQFYGNVYTTYYVGSNGYITLSGGSSTYTNTCFPAAGMPIGMYAFWDDLYPPGGGQIATYYDAVEGEFIVEYYNTNHCCNSTTPESFEFVIFDTDVHPTETGDNDILFQYIAPLTNVTSNTVGIQSPAQNYYLQYVCNNVLEPNSAGVVSGRAILFSTGPGCVAGAPDISINPTSVSGSAPLGGQDSEILQVCNTGLCDLSWSITFTQFTPASAVSTIHPVTVSMTKDQLDALDAMQSGLKSEFAMQEERGSSPLDAFGGPDGFGYRWIDSDEANGPDFSWVEINAVGTNSGLTADDQTVNVGLPWSFEYYGITYTSINISSNGNAHFGTANTSYFNLTIPNVTAPFGMLAAFWDDLYLPGGGSVYYYDDAANNRFIIEWENINHYPGTGDSYTFQILIYQSGTIVYQYLDMLTGPTGVTSATVGFQNDTGTDGLQVVYNAAYITDGLAIRIYGVEDWLSFGGPTGGTLAPGNCVNIPLNFDAGELAAGTYNGQLDIDSNDPDENPLTIPVTFTVGSFDPPAGLTIYYTAATNELLFTWQSTGAPEYILYSATTSGGPFTTFEGSTSGTSLTIPSAGLQKQFFIVVSSDGTVVASAPGESAQELTR